MRKLPPHPNVLRVLVNSFMYIFLKKKKDEKKEKRKKKNVEGENKKRIN